MKSVPGQLHVAPSAAICDSIALLGLLLPTSAVESWHHPRFLFLLSLSDLSCRQCSLLPTRSVTVCPWPRLFPCPLFSTRLTEPRRRLGSRKPRAPPPLSFLPRVLIDRRTHFLKAGAPFHIPIHCSRRMDGVLLRDDRMTAIRNFWGVCLSVFFYTLCAG